ncbi:hypothetical protein ACQEVC_08775 [Plantactinospora sp. CA-294935]
MARRCPVGSGAYCASGEALPGRERSLLRERAAACAERLPAPAGDPER